MEGLNQVPEAPVVPDATRVLRQTKANRYSHLLFCAMIVPKDLDLVGEVLKGGV